MKRWVLAFPCVMVLACSAKTPVRPGSNSGSCDACTIPNPVGTSTTGGPGIDSGRPGVDGAVDAAPGEFTGTLRLFPGLPPVTAVNSNVGWILHALAPLDVDAGTPPVVDSGTPFGPDGSGDLDIGSAGLDIGSAGLDVGTVVDRDGGGAFDRDAGVTAEGTTDNVGSFRLTGTVAAGVAPGELGRQFWLEASFPVMSGFSSLFALPEGARSATLETVNDDVIRTTLSGVGLTPDDTRAMIAVYVRESLAAGALPVAGVGVAADGSSAVLYDGVSGTMEVGSMTGRRGFALIPNVPVPSTGDGFVSVRAGSALPHQVRVRRRTVTWVTLTAS